MLISNNFSGKYNEGVAVFVQPPARRVVNICMLQDDGAEDDYIGNYFLSFPHVAFRIHYARKRDDKAFTARSLKVIFTNSKAIRKKFVPSLPNIEDGFSVCIPLPAGPFTTVEELVDKVVARFWSTEFNSSMFDALMEYRRDSLMKNYDKWQDKTKKQPKWIPNARSLVEISGFNREQFFGKSFKEDQLYHDDYDDDYD